MIASAGVALCYSHPDTQSSGTVSGNVVLQNYVSAICCNAADILQQAAVLITGNYKLFEAASKIIATEITGFCQHFSDDLILKADGHVILELNLTILQRV